MKHDRALSKLRTNKISYLLQNFQRAVYGNCGLLYKLNSSVSLLTMIALRCQNCFKMALLSFKYFYFPSNNFPFLQRFLPPFFFYFPSNIFALLQYSFKSFLLSFKCFCFPSSTFLFLQICFFWFSSNIFCFPSVFIQIFFVAFLQIFFFAFLQIPFFCFPAKIFIFSPWNIFCFPSDNFAFLQIVLFFFQFFLLSCKDFYITLNFIAFL